MAVSFEEVSARWSGAPPVAVELETAARLLEVAPAQVEAAAANLIPLRHQDGTLRWSLAKLADALGLATRTNKGQVKHARMPARGLTRDPRRVAWRRAAGTGPGPGDLPAGELADVEDLELGEVEDLAELGGQ
jgi:hypothetical protein